MEKKQKAKIVIEEANEVDLEAFDKLCNRIKEKGYIMLTSKPKQKPKIVKFK